jgi:hypothetical protein
MILKTNVFMEKDKLKSLLNKLKILVDELESEIYSDVDLYKTSYGGTWDHPSLDYDEVFYDDEEEDIPNTRIGKSYQKINDDDGDGL